LLVPIGCKRGGDVARPGVAVVFTGAGEPLTHRRIEVADPGEGEVLVRVLGCTLCGSDLHSYLGRRSTPLPTILGHEILGRIECFGPGAPTVDATGLPLAVGDRVTWTLAASCGGCFYCDRGLPQKCQRLFKYGHEILSDETRPDGGLADHSILRPGTTIVRLPEALSDAAACPANCATATVAAAIEAAGELRGGSVLLVGSGMLGLTTCAMARNRGAVDVLACDHQETRRARTLDFGATLVVAPADLPAAAAAVSGGFGVDLAMDLAGAPEAFELLLPLVRPGGTIVEVGAVFPAKPVSLFLEQLVRRCLTLRGVHNYAPHHLVAAVEFLSRTAYPFATLVSGWVPLAEAQTAFRRAAEPQVFRIGIRP
jgi:alcohol dehydrogenase